MGYQNRQINQYLQIIDEGMKKLHTFIPPEDASYHKPYNNKIQDYGKQYDYIIVGGGSAGTVIASRLSENDKTSVLLLEAGGIEDAFINIPGMDVYSYGLEYNWSYKTTPQSTSCLGTINKQCAYPRGKGLGGSSLINALIYSRGNKEDYDNWRRMGNPGWSYKDLLPYFKKSENFTLAGDLKYHGTSGNFHVENHKPSSPQLDSFIEANAELGYKVVDYNGENQIGAAKTQLNYKDGRRQSSAKAFLYSVLSRDNLEVLTHSYVTKVNVDEITKKALGVTFTYNNALYTVSAKKEVIISAGVIGSPQILMLSGIGPRKHLEKHKIKWDSIAYDASWGTMNPQQCFTILCVLLHPKSYGTLRLKSSNPYDYPLIDPRYLSDKEGKDIELLYESIQFAIKLINTKAFQKLNASLLEQPFEPCSIKYRFLSKKYWYCHLRHFTLHIFHGSGTCKMGPNEKNSVVDHNLKVYGITGLRVADASVFPTPTSGHNNAVVTMIAEKVSDLIKKSC
ncbi:hypothetical protein FQR65_LT08160 [Abscondita terminalis]|nr:hypothetical protein FQR65_LT08160 [Abscondita terminalis]